ncbi:LysR substrate-binding domain-containing protein [Pseudolabrys sp. FHR47]|uniref:LysR substrate-binding domain-containing protein n=1 Tax=Pseudolabrys sp. FHR47 TaxID=2562284 RepID=UPI00143DBDCF|nr:LysR substrate-binding domain-containing protein [Pseudolabrys sp. FHR47]
MELRHLKYFAAVAEELHFGRAAARLNISAPTLSHQILALENMLGAKLFLRRTKSTVTLTQTGKRFLVEAYATLKQAANAELIGRRAARGEVGSIALGYVFSAGMSGFLSRHLVAFREKHPDVSLQLRRAVTFEQFRALSDDTLDIGFTAAPQSYPTGLTGFIVDRQPFYVAIPEGNPIAKLKRVTPDDIADERFVAVSLEMEVGFGGGNIAAITPPGKSLHIVERAPDIFSVLTLCAAGAGLSVMSEPMVNVGIPGIVFRKVEGAFRGFELALVHRRNEAAPAIRTFIDFVRSSTRQEDAARQRKKSP